MPRLGFTLPGALGVTLPLLNLEALTRYFPKEGFSFTRETEVRVLGYSAFRGSPIRAPMIMMKSTSGISNHHLSPFAKGLAAPPRCVRTPRVLGQRYRIRPPACQPGHSLASVG